jgi:hypothetical protein
MTLAQAVFERAVRRLDGDATREFVADLLAARGYRTTVEDGVVTAAADSGRSMRLLVVGGLRDATVARRDTTPGTVLTVGGALAEALGPAVVSRTSGGANRPTVLGVETLYQWFAYAVDAEARATLEAQYLGATEPSAFERARTGFADAVEDAAERLVRLPVPTRVTVAVVLVALLALVAVTTAGPLVPFGSSSSAGADPGDEDAATPPAVTSVPVTVTPAHTPTPSGPPLPDACPPAPTGAHPSSLRPAVRQTATAGGLDGWGVLLTQNLSEHEFDPNDQRAGLVPEIRHIAVFERPGGAQYRLGVDRWASPARAAESVARGGPWGLGVLWGAYTARVEWDDGDTGDAAAARQLLAAVTTPDGTRLGSACVSEIDSGPAATATP